MSGPSFIKIAAVPAAELAERVPLSEEARALIKPGLEAVPFFEALVAQNLFQDAIRILSAALPARESVWWSCTCVRETMHADTAPALAAAVQAAEAWVYKPTDENRRAAKSAADLSGLKGAAGWTAMAAFWSGGSITAADAPAVEPGGALLPAAISGAVLLAAVQYEPQRAEERYRSFIAAGVDIASGGNGRRKPPAQGA